MASSEAPSDPVEPSLPVDPSLEDGEMSIAPLDDTNRNTNLDRARREFRPVAPRPEV